MTVPDPRTADGAPARWTWLGATAFFFAWIFVIHGVEFMLHEVAGHGVAYKIFACGFDGFDLTYFGGGVMRPTPCPRQDWLWRSLAIMGYAGIAVTISAGAVAMAFQRRAGLTPLGRLLLALLATHILISELRYATAGGYHVVMDPQALAAMLEAFGLHVLAWLPPLVLYAAAALYGARRIVDAFREHFGSRTRLHMLKQSTTTLGAAYLLFFVAYRIEAAIRTDMRAATSIAVATERRAAVLKEAPWVPIHRFPIGRVLVAIAVAAFVLALARPVAPGDGAEDAAPGTIPRRYAAGVAVAALVCFVAITLLRRI
jgi:hypothetical protein